MPFIVPFSVKAALTTGAIIGGTVAVINNREKLYEVAAEFLEKGAEFCRERSKTQPIETPAYALEYQDGEYSNFDEEGNFIDGVDEGSETDEMTTPDTTDIDSDFDLLRITTRDYMSEDIDVVSLD